MKALVLVLPKSPVTKHFDSKCCLVSPDVMQGNSSITALQKGEREGEGDREEISSGGTLIGSERLASLLFFYVSVGDFWSK